MAGVTTSTLRSRIRANLAANVVGALWAALIQVAVIPFYIRLMGIEAYGLIGFFVVLQSALQLLELGLGPTANRELARYSAQAAKATEARDFLRTFEVPFWAAGGLAAATIVGLAPLISAHWLRASTLSPQVVVTAVQLMGLMAALQLPLTLYQGGLLGIQRHVGLNAVRAGASTFAAAVTLAALRLISPDPTVFFTAQSACLLLQVLLLRGLLWSGLAPGHRRPALAFSLLRRVSGFAAGMAGISITGICLMQMDKALLSRLLPLEQFGYYALAGSAASALYLAITPLFNTFFPRFSVLAASGSHDELSRLYHAASQLMAVLVLPAAAVLATWSGAALFAWTGDAGAVKGASPVLPLLVAGTALNGLMNIPYALQLSAGWTRLGVILNLVFLALALPAIWLLATRFGAPGGAAVWAGVNALYVVLGVPLTHRRLLPGEAARWFLRDVGPPLGATVGTCALLALVLPTPSSRVSAVVVLGGSLAVVLASAALSGAQSRAWFREQWALARLHGPQSARGTTPCP